MATLAIEVVRVGVSAVSNWTFVVMTDGDGFTGLGEATLNRAEAEVTRVVCRLAGEAATMTAAQLEATLDSRLAQPAPTLEERIALSAVDQALTDLLARRAGCSLTEHLGDTPSGGDVFGLYANINRAVTSDRSPAAFADMAARAVDAGHRSVKCAPFDAVEPGPDVFESPAYRLGCERLRAISDRIGRGPRLMVDCHWRFRAQDCPALFDDLLSAGVSTAECPAAEADLASLARGGTRLRGRGIEVAGGELCTTPEQFDRLAQSDAFDVLTPDVKYCGGVRALYSIGAALVAGGVGFSPHNPSGPVACLASAHVLAALDLATTELEFPFGECDWRSRLVGGAERVDAARLGPLSGHGLGARLDADVVAANPPRAVRPTVSVARLTSGLSQRVSWQGNEP